MRCMGLLFVCLMLLACSESTQQDVGAPNRQFSDDTEQQSADRERMTALSAQSALDLAKAPMPQSGRSYDLAELIDIAQRRNPATVQAWLLAREAGRASGVVGSALEPVVALSAVAGSQRFNTSQDDIPIVGDVSTPIDASGSALVLTANWLLFDFGENKARQRAAESLSRIANLGFNRVHQQLIYDVSFAYHARIAALSKMTAASQASDRANDLIVAAEKRMSQGVGTTVEVAQARQLAAQTRVIRINTEGEARSAAVSLAALLALPPNTPIRLKLPQGRLPRADDKQLETIIENAFLSRSDVLAALTQVNAAEADLDAVAASYLPKIYGGAYTSAGNDNLNINGVLPIGLTSTGSTGGFVGVTVPIYTGRAREGRLKGAQDRVEQSKSGLQVAKLAATREIALAYESLRTALAVRSAAAELVNASRVTSDATLQAFDGGIGDIRETSAAALGQFAAEEALADATRNARQAAATLALATGQ